ncbi:MAG: leucyl aminopeptidase family protein [Paracoccaceae bacterium]|nr:leucyl aminopeptidase family protein [Paracoccaceae bacterium]
MAHFASDIESACPIEVIDKEGFNSWLVSQSTYIKSWVSENKFQGNLFDFLIIPSPVGKVEKVVFGWGTEIDRTRDRFHFAKIRDLIPNGTYKITTAPNDFNFLEAYLGWALSGYRFANYKNKKSSECSLVVKKKFNNNVLNSLVSGEFWTRDLINRPASDLGPKELEQETRNLAKRFSADISVITGQSLTEQNFPMIHAVGRSSTQEPRLIDLTWGNEKAPKVTLVGKGVCFDTGGLNIKPGKSMGLMKKDMGGAATVLGLALMLLEAQLDIRLRVLIPAVENSISSSSFRPQDILKSRKGLTVEINNTDAEGRLILADAISLADEEAPELLICMATLTGAARIALGSDIAPFYTDDDDLAKKVFDFGEEYFDPTWRMPFWNPYERMIEPTIADLDNAPRTSFAGSLTAALFLRRFVTKSKNFIHFDIYGWSDDDRIARSKGGVGMASRALYYLIRGEYGKHT